MNCATRRPALNSELRPACGRTRKIDASAAARVRYELQLLLAFVTRDERAPRLGANRTFGLPYDVELTVSLDFADHHRLVQVVIGLVHGQREPGRRLERLAGHCYANLVDVGGPRLLHRLRCSAHSSPT